MYTTADFKGNCFRIHINYARQGHNSILLFSVKYILHFVFYHSTMFLKGPCQPIKTFYMLTVTYQHHQWQWWLLIAAVAFKPINPVSHGGGRGGRILPITQKFHNSSIRGIWKIGASWLIAILNYEAISTSFGRIGPLWTKWEPLCRRSVAYFT